MIKRAVDIIFSILGLLLLVLFYPFIWLVVRGSVKPVLIFEESLGKNKKPIRLCRINLRPPVNGIDVGRIRKRLLTLMRTFRVDGWPLVYNVLKGDLSLIGPYPEKKAIVDSYSPAQMKVLAVRPGVIGPYYFQSGNGKKRSFENNAEWENYYLRTILPEKLKVELQYVKNTFLGRDLKVLADRVWQKIGHAINEHLMREGKNRNVFLPLDLLFIVVSYLFSYLLRFEWVFPAAEYTIFLKSLPLILFLRVVTFYSAGLYKNLWKYVGIRDLISIINAVTISSILAVSVIYLIGISAHSRSVFLIDWLLCIGFVGGSRLVLRLFNESITYEKRLKRNVLIIGAGDVGEMLLRELDKNSRHDLRVVGFIDDDESTHGRTIHGVKVLGASEDIPDVVQLLRVDEALITVNEFSSEEIKAIVKYCKEAGVRHRMVPAVSDLLSGTVHLSRFRKVEISDLFGRQPVELDLSAIDKFIRGKKVMITGAGGSIGSELCRQIAEYQPATITLVDKNENYLHEIHNELAAYDETIETHCCLNDITHKKKQELIFKSYQPDIVFHAAAQKHVPLSERNPEEAVINNIIGTKTIADLAVRFGVRVFVMVSTDKAVNPTSVMGVTKRIAELYIQAVSGKSKTKFVTVRFGNVLNSNGSVVPTFMKQIERGGPITVTHPVVERYFMSIAEAVQLILQAATMGKSSEIFILNMGKSIRIVDLATELIKQSGMRPNEDIKIKFTGLRPGEKLFEELIGRDEELLPTSHTGIKTLRNKNPLGLAKLENYIKELAGISEEMNVEKLLAKLKMVVPEYQDQPKALVPEAEVGRNGDYTSTGANSAEAVLEN